MENETIVEEIKHKIVWKSKYTMVLLINIIYIIIFYYLMLRFS